MICKKCKSKDVIMICGRTEPDGTIIKHYECKKCAKIWSVTK